MQQSPSLLIQLSALACTLLLGFLLHLILTRFRDFREHPNSFDPTPTSTRIEYNLMLKWINSANMERLGQVPQMLSTYSFRWRTTVRKRSLDYMLASLEAAKLNREAYLKSGT